MNKYLILIIVIFISEIILAFIFAACAQWYYKKLGLDFPSIIKGIIERIFIMIMLINQLPHALTLFSALKLGTRLKHNENKVEAENRFNDYYLVGNLVSVAVAVLYSYLYTNFDSIQLFH